LIVKPWYKKIERIKLKEDSDYFFKYAEDASLIIGLLTKEFT